MSIESIEEFLARGGSVEKSDSEYTLAELLEKEGILNQADASAAAESLSQTIIKNINDKK